MASAWVRAMRLIHVHATTHNPPTMIIMVAARYVANPMPQLRPYGHQKGFADDHLHLDIGYAVLTPRGRDEYTVR